MYPIRFFYTPADDDADGFASALTGAGPWVPDEATVSGDGLAHLVTISSTADLDAITFTITGKDADGFAQTEDILGPDNTTVTGVKYFSEVTDIAASETVGVETFNVGWKDTCVGPTFPLNWRQKTFQVSLGVVVTGTINVTVQHLIDDVRRAAPSTMKWWPHSTIVSKAADTDGNYASPVSATRLLVNSLTASATVAFLVEQGR
jgi:hypothetical protein